jgi:hypothetical protein
VCACAACCVGGVALWCGVVRAVVRAVWRWVVWVAV